MDYFDFAAPLPNEFPIGSVKRTASLEMLIPDADVRVRTPVGMPSPDGHISVSVSTAFQPNTKIDGLLPDLVLVSSDNVFFHVNYHVLRGASENFFGALLHADLPYVDDGHPSVTSLPESADVVNIVVHTIYSMSCTQFSPTFETIDAAVDALLKYGMPIKTYIVSGSPLFNLILAQAPYRPIDTYALVAAHDLYDLAVTISSHLLAYPLPSLTDKLSARMGPIYLKRLFFLHYGRMEALKNLVLRPPGSHSPTQICNSTQQTKLTRVWALACAQMVWDARPNLSTSAMQAALSPLEQQLSCDLCKHALFERIEELVREWSAIKRTI
ncbi:hypothetical protein A0H81_11807 [Grifola frondosa]|uniref:BTB domain-containing protein n=1 Tax=Grifola frondosa TaxID=5627 RepID=A0A1C7LW32_GRIFR|nr:hypothetical protein A0H81_11807 [Grifola frondosa]